MDEFTVTCSCGQQKRVSGSAFGMRDTCANCGATLEINEQTAAPMAQPSASSPFEEPSTSGQAASSPFEEASPTEQATPTLFAEPPPPAQPSPPPLADASGDANMVSHIFERPLQTPGESSAHPPVDTQPPAGADSGSRASAPAAPEPSARPATACARCGKKFRGDWDRLKTAEGAICYICSNQGAAGTPERLKPEHVETVAPVIPPGQEAPDLEPPPAPTFLGIDTETPQFKRVILIAGLAVMGLTFVLVMFGGLEVPMDGTRMEEAQEVEVHPALSLVLTIWGYVLVFLAGLFAVYFFQRGTDKLDHNVLWMDFLQTSWPILQLTFIHFGLLYVAMLISVIPMAGGIFAALLGLTRIFIAYYICSNYFDFFVRDFVVVYLLYKVISVVLTALGYGFFGMIANLFL